MRQTMLRSSLGALAAIMLLFGAGGCGFAHDQGSVEGIWESQGADRVYLEVTSRRITTYDYAGDAAEGGADCYRVTVANVVTRNDNDWTLSSAAQPNLRIQLTIEVVDGVLSITTDGISERFVPSERGVSSFEPECPAR